MSTGWMLGLVGIRIVFLAEGSARCLPKEGGRGRSQLNTRDYDSQYMKAMTKKQNTCPAASPFMNRYRRLS